MIYLIKSWLSLLKHVSQQCSSTLSTEVESNLIFTMHESLEFQIFFIWWQLLQASASFLSLSFTVLSIEVPRYLNLLTTSKVLLVLGLILLDNSLLYIKTLVSFSFNCSATFDDSCYTHVVTAFAPGEYLWNAMASVKSWSHMNTAWWCLLVHAFFVQIQGLDIFWCMTDGKI